MTTRMGIYVKNMAYAGIEHYTMLVFLKYYGIVAVHIKHITEESPISPCS
jgi:hypothetical protein